LLFITRFQIIPEEAAMEKLFTDEFLYYKKRTRRWI
jgi:protein-S-isoprenylcysteine O-methyltransferase Ste14